MKIAVFGGSFDPPHLGHFEIIKRSLDQFDKIIIVPSKCTSQKNIPVATENDRIIMLALMFSSFNNIEIDQFELNSLNLSHTFLTIEYLKEKYLSAEFTLLLGTDQLKKFDSWYRADELLKSVNIYGFNRRDSMADSTYRFNIDMEFNIPYSSSEIKDLIHINCLDVSKMLDTKVYDYIIQNNLYQS